MRRFLAGSILLMLLPLSPAALADEEADHQALRELRAIWERSINEDNLDLIAPHLGTPFHGVMMTSRPVSSLQEMKDYWAAMKKLMGSGGTYRTTVEPERSILLGDFALARGKTSDVVTTDEGRVYRFGTNWTAVLQRQNGAWKILQVQGSMDPVGNEFVRTFMRDALLKYGSGIAIVALGIGIVIGMLIGRRRAAVRNAT